MTLKAQDKLSGVETLADLKLTPENVGEKYTFGDKSKAEPPKAAEPSSDNLDKQKWIDLFAKAGARLLLERVGLLSKES